MSEERRLGRYLLKRKIATGGMAEIWLARQAGPAGFEKELVIKRILPHIADDEVFVEMFLDEARLAAKLTHPNIVQIFDLGEADGDYFIAMEYIDGVDLEGLVERAVAIGRPLHPAIVARLIADACVGLAYAHEYTDNGVRVGLVHRDISPQNILVSRDGIVKLVDFGVAKAATSQHKTQTGAVKGKLSYMSPEQIAGKTLDGRSDLFALGIVLYELLTNQRPFGHESELMAVTAIMSHQPTAPTALAPNLPTQLEMVVLQALEKQVDQRFATARDMQLALEQYLQSAGIILSQRDVAEYLTDLFSDHPTGTIRALESARPASPYNTQPQMAHTTNTAPQAPLPQPDFAPPLAQTGPQMVANASTPTGPQPGVADGPPNYFTGPQPVQETKKKGGAGVWIALLIGLLLIGGAGYYLFTEVLAEDESGEVAEADDAQDDPTELAQGDPVPTDDPTNNGAANQGQNGAANQGQNGAANQGQNGAANQGQNTMANQGQNGAANQGQNTMANQGQNGAANQGQNGAANPQPPAGSGDTALIPPSQGDPTLVPPSQGDPTLVPPSQGDPAGVDPQANNVVDPTADTTDPNGAQAADGSGASAEGSGDPEVAEPGENTEETPEVEPTRVRFRGARGTVWINGDRRGRVPGTYEVEPGQVRIRVSGEGREMFTDRIRVDAGETESVRVSY